MAHARSSHQLADLRDKPASPVEANGDTGRMPWHHIEGHVQSIALLPGYSVEDVRRDFKKYSTNPAAHDQRRWEMYACIVLLLRQPGSCLTSAAQAERRLSDRVASEPQAPIADDRAVSSSYTIPTALPSSLPCGAHAWQVIELGGTTRLVVIYQVP